MRAREILILSLAALPLVPQAARSADPKAPRRAVYARQLPAGPGKAIAERWCLMCHTATLTTQQAKDSTGWEKSIAQMEAWGVKLSPAERDTLRRYLLLHFGRRAPG